jgi:DNA helicase-2/ATP-dependent DNA helicase PcrA
VERDPAIKEERSYSFSPYLAAWIMLYYYKRPNGKFLPLASDRLVLIDEAQNLMPLEITLICKINSRVTLNLFGDVNQHVPSEKGVNSWPEKLLQSMKTQKFNLNQNYRNAESITRFCNEELDLDMIPISLEGDPIHVEEISSWKMLPKALESRIRQRKKGYRFAILYKGVKMPDALAAISGKFGANELDEENADISREKINIAHVRVVKGIEFDEAVVIDSGDLLREELYIAYTRALARLSVIRIRNSRAKRSKTEV